MNNGIRFRSSRHLIKSLNLNSSTQNKIIYQLNTSKNSNSLAKKDIEYRSKFLNKTFNSAKKIKKSLENIQIKKQKIKISQSSFFSQKIQKLRAINNIAKVEIKFRKAAAIIQRVFRGYLVRRQYKSILLKFIKDGLANGIQNLDKKVNLIWKNAGVVKDSVVGIQRAVRRFLKKKLLENNQIKLEMVKKTNAAVKIQKWVKRWWYRKEDEKIKKLEKIRKNLSFLKVIHLWNQRKFNWNTIKKHYGLTIEDNCSTNSIVEKIIIITPKMTNSGLPKGKFIKKQKKPQKSKQKLKPKVLKSCLITSNSACSKNADSEKFAESLALPSIYKDDRTDSRLNTSENNIDIEFGTHLDKIKNLFKEINLDEEIGNELIESFSKF